MHAKHRHQTAAGLCGVLIGMTAHLATVSQAGAAAPQSPFPAPEYSFDAASPSVIAGIGRAGAILELAHPDPLTAVSPLALGLSSADDDIDGLSAANATSEPTDPFALQFSVDRGTVGAAAPDPSLVILGIPYNVSDQAERHHVSGDQFVSTGVFDLGRLPGDQTGSSISNNALCRNNYNEGGTDFEANPATHAADQLPAPVPEDRVDATARLERAGAEGPVARAYFSLAAASPSLPLLSGPASPSGANVFVYYSEFMGACCRSESPCEMSLQDVCTDGTWLGAGSTCASCSGVEPVGACCIPTGTCSMTAENACFGGGMTGIWLGEGVSCAECGILGADGSCCLPTGECIVIALSDCTLLGGTYAVGDFCEGDPGGDGFDDACQAPLYATAAELGLTAADDVDGLIVFDRNNNGRFDAADQVVFSLTPASPSLGTISGASSQGSAADVFIVHPNMMPVTLIAAGEVGLGNASDNIDALDFGPVESAPSRADIPAHVVDHGIRALPVTSTIDLLRSAADIAGAERSKDDATGATIPEAIQQQPLP